MQAPPLKIRNKKTNKMEAGHSLVMECLLMGVCEVLGRLHQIIQGKHGIEASVVPQAYNLSKDLGG